MAGGRRFTAVSAVVPLDVTGSPDRLVTVNHGGLEWGPIVAEIVEAYRDDPPVLAIFDPLVSFGASESMVNDNEQALIEVARAVVKGLGCCVRYVHHVGKSNARENLTDQYVGRGGSALPDGCRMVAALAPWDRKESLPEGCAPGEGVSIFRIERPKLSYAPPGLPRLWIRREGYRYGHFVEPPLSAVALAEARAAQLLRFLEAGLDRPEPEFYSKKAVADHREELGMSRDQVRAAVSSLISRGAAIEAWLPKGRRVGAWKRFLCPRARASEFPEDRE